MSLLFDDYTLNSVARASLLWPFSCLQVSHDRGYGAHSAFWGCPQPTQAKIPDIYRTIRAGSRPESVGRWGLLMHSWGARIAPHTLEMPINKGLAALLAWIYRQNFSPKHQRRSGASGPGKGRCFLTDGAPWRSTAGFLGKSENRFFYYLRGKNT